MIDTQKNGTGRTFKVHHASKKALMIASVASMLDNFNRSNIDILLDIGYKVVIAGNFHTKEDINSQEKIDEFSKEMKAKGVKCVQIDFSRRVTNLFWQLKSIRQVKKLLTYKFDLIHCHSPICSAIVRLVAQKYRKKYGTKVIYTAHGFHFFKGAPLKNWILFYPIEKWASKYTDILITINHEDYHRARKKFKAVKTVYIPGVGVDTEKFNRGFVDINSKRRELGLKSDDFMLLSVGELSVRKNQKVVIEALGKIQDQHIHYFIAGIGEKEKEYKDLAGKLGLEDNVHLLGYRTDISELCQIADLFVFPSAQEGLPMALMEAIACKTPVLCSNIRGNTDLVKDKKYLFYPGDVGSLISCLDAIISAKDRDSIKRNAQPVVKRNFETLKKCDIKAIEAVMSKMYQSAVGHYSRDSQIED